MNNLNFAASTTTYPSGTTTAASLGTCLGSTAQWNQGNNKTQFCYAGSGKTGAANSAYAGILLDGALLRGFEKGIQGSPTSNGVNLSFCVDSPDALSPGQHTACLTAADSAGTLTIPSNDSPGSSSILTISERSTGGSGYSAPATTFTWLSGDYRTDHTYGGPTGYIAGSTITMVTNNVPLKFIFIGNSETYSNVNERVALMVDSNYIANASATKGNVFGNHNAANRTDFPMTFVWESTYPFTAGTHTVSLMADGDSSGSRGLYCSSAMPCFLSMTEVRNAAGTGDACTNCNQTFSGNNSFIGQVHVSSGFVNNFVASAFNVNQTALNTSATVTGSTGSFTVQGSTVECWVSGSAEGSASGNGMIATITVDGSATAIPGTSATVGAFSCTSGASSPFICPIKDHREFQVTAGVSHTFVLYMWMISSTATWPGAKNVGQFGCREVPSR
jgi:hypothetical protein